MLNLILASGSKARASMLRNAGYDLAIQSTDIDEQAIKEKLSENEYAFHDIAIALADEKARAINDKKKYIIGSDQLLIFNNKLLSKSKNMDEAKEKLLMMQGKSHQLISAVSVLKNDETIWFDFDVATLHMKEMDENQIDNYLKIAQQDALQCVGGYAIEGYGIRLFQDVVGDYFTIMGMPLLKLINFLDEENVE